MDDLKLYAKNPNNLECLLSNVKIFSDNIGMHFSLDKCTKVTFRKGSLVKPKNIILNINTQIAELENNKAYTYLEINETGVINHSINKEKIRK